MEIIRVLVFVFFLSTTMGIYSQEQATEDGVQEDEAKDEAIIVKRFTETLFKLALYGTQLADKDLIIMVSETYAVPVQAGLLAIRNPTWNNIKDYVVSNLLPDYSKQGSYLETIYDKELMRDVDQYIKYAETALNYGLNMAVADEPVRLYLSPEKGVVEEFEMVDGVVVEEARYSGYTASEYQGRITSLYTDIMAYEPTGDPLVDDAAIEEMTFAHFENEQDHAKVLALIVSMNEAEYTGNETTDQEIMSAIFDTFFEETEPDEVVEEPGDVVLPTDGEWDNGLSGLMADMGVGDRDPRNRYGQAAEPYYTEYSTEVMGGNESAQVALTNVFKAWETLQITKYADEAIELEKLVSEFYENGVDFDTGKLKELTGQMRAVWDLIKSNK